MALARYQFTVTDAAGNAIPGASVEVRREVTGLPLVQLFSDRDGNVPIGNPILADADGFAAFHVQGGAFKITATSGAFERIWRYVPIGTLQEFDFGTSGILSFDWDAIVAELPATLGANLRLNGTSIGDLASGGGLSAAFDNTTNQALAASANKASATSGYVGRSFSAPKRVFRTVVYGSNDQGYVNGSNPTVTLELYARNDAAPSSATDGTLLGSLSFTDTGNESGNPRTLTSNDQDSEWDHAWVRISHNGAATTIAVAECQVFEAIAGRGAYDGEAKGFSVLVESDVDHANLPTVYYKLSNVSGDWSDGFVFPAIRLKAALPIVLDAGDSVIATGPSHSYLVPFPGIITSWTLLGNGIGSIELDIWKSTYASYPPIEANSVVGGNYPALISANKSQDTVLSGWNTALAEGDVLRINVRSCSGLTKVTLQLDVQRT